MIVYNKEKELGLESKILAQSSVTAQLSVKGEGGGFTKAGTPLCNPPVSTPPTPDLMAVQGILVSTNWNKNDDVFSPKEVWDARMTPLFKPANMNHQGKEVDGENRTLGVIVNVIPVDDAYSPIDNSPGAPIPSNYDLLIDMYLWQKYWPTDTQAIQDGIDSNSMFISMECLFDDFGYALVEKNKFVVEQSSQSVALVPRNADTSWLTANLKAYGGAGEVILGGKVYRVGRWLRKQCFSGVGFTPKPANDDSILFNNYISHASINELTSEDFQKQFVDLINNGVLIIDTGTISLWQT